MEKANTDSVLPVAGDSEAVQFAEKKSPAEVESSEEGEMSNGKARFLELREGLAGWKWGLFHAICFFGGAISGILLHSYPVRCSRFSWDRYFYRFSPRKQTPHKLIDMC